MKCPACKKDTLKHLHASAHGLEETHMSGTEHYECECGFAVWNKEDAEQYGLKFVYD